MALSLLSTVAESCIIGKCFMAATVDQAHLAQWLALTEDNQVTQH